MTLKYIALTVFTLLVAWKASLMRADRDHSKLIYERDVGTRIFNELRDAACRKDDVYLRQHTKLVVFNDYHRMMEFRRHHFAPKDLIRQEMYFYYSYAMNVGGMFLYDARYKGEDGHLCNARLLDITAPYMGVSDYFDVEYDWHPIERARTAWNSMSIYQQNNMKEWCGSHPNHRNEYGNEDYRVICRYLLEPESLNYYSYTKVPFIEATVEYNGKIMVWQWQWSGYNKDTMVEDKHETRPKWKLVSILRNELPIPRKSFDIIGDELEKENGRRGGVNIRIATMNELNPLRIQTLNYTSGDNSVARMKKLVPNLREREEYIEKGILEIGAYTNWRKNINYY